jgi:hypothetical protein
MNPLIKKRRNGYMSNLASRNSSRVSSLRSYLRGLARRRSSGTVTADDAQNFLTRQGMPNYMTSDRLAVINAVFQSGDFESVGRVASSRPEAKGRTITEWSLA